MKILFVWSGMLTVVLLSGCISTVQPLKISDRIDVSTGELHAVVKEAIDGALTCVRFQEFLKVYREEEKKDERDIPIVKLANVRNDTDDPDFKVGLLTDLLVEALINSNIVDVAVEGVEGYGGFYPGCVIPCDTPVKAAHILLRPKVVSREVREGGARYISYLFLMEMINIKYGLVMWEFKKQLAFMKYTP